MMIENRKVMTSFRTLTAEQIASLEALGNTAEDWSQVRVSEDFQPFQLQQSRLEGEVRIGSEARIIHSRVRNCQIGEGSLIEDVTALECRHRSSFGNGVGVATMNECGGRTVRIFDTMSAQMAYVMALYRHRPQTLAALERMIDRRVEERQSEIGRVGRNCRIVGARFLREVCIGDEVRIDGASLLENATLCDGVEIGVDVKACDLIAAEGARIGNGSTVERCFVGESCILDKGFTAAESLFFANSHCENGEAVSVFAGPFSVSHHKSALLIGSIYSFMNAGSATNFSNHQYKLGPLHQGIFGRGVKFGSGSYMMLPVRVAPFSTVIGHHYGRIDTVDMPFSYILETESGSCLVPGANLTNCGFFRDVRKWPARDRRGIDGKQDCIVYNAFSPLTASAMLRGMRRLAVLRSADRSSKSPVSYGGCLVSQSSIVKGLAKYEAALKFYMGNVIVERIEDAAPVYAENIAEALRPEFSVGSGDWVDMAGLLAPKEEVAAVLDDIENGTLQSLEEMDARFQKIASNYKLYEWCWVYTHINDVFGIDPLTMDKHRLVDLVRQWDRAAGMLYSGIEKDASKEYSTDAMTGYGADGTFDEAGSDFLNVRGDYESDFLVQAVRESRQMISDRAHEIILSF